MTLSFGVVQSLELQLQTSTTMEALSILFLLGLVALIIWLSFHLNKKHLQKRRYAKPFAWGYYNGLLCCIILPVGLLCLIAGLGDQDADTVLGGAFMAAIGSLGPFILMRRRWAFLVLVVLSFNPIAWIINGIYLSNRWREMAMPDDAEGPAQTPAPVRKLTLSASPEVVAPPPVPGIPVEMGQKIYIAQNGQRTGPFDTATVESMRKAKMILPGSLYWHSGMKDWAPLEPATPPPTVV